MPSGKNFLPAKHLISSVSMASSVSPVTADIRYLDNVCVQFIYTGTPTGTFTVGGSVDGVTFTSLSLSPTPAAAGSAGTILLDLNQLSFPYIQVGYTATSGAGTLDVWVGGKGV